MARVVAHVADLLFGSKVQAMLGAGGHDAGVRKRAIAAGFHLVVPRSRMAREGSALVDGLVE